MLASGRALVTRPPAPAADSRPRPGADAPSRRDLPGESGGSRERRRGPARPEQNAPPCAQRSASRGYVLENRAAGSRSGASARSRRIPRPDRYLGLKVAP